MIRLTHYADAMAGPITITPVRDKAGLSAFLQVPFAVFRDDPCWVPPLRLERQDHLDRKKNPYFRHAEAQLFVATVDGHPMGRISAQWDRLRNTHHKDDVGQFGFLDAPDQPEIFAALLSAAENWLRQRGALAAQGPFSFSINDETGCLIDGFDTPPSMMMGHARPHYGARIMEQGYRKAKDVIAYHFDGMLALPRAMDKMFGRAMADPDIAVRALDKSHLARDLDIIIAIFNDAWSGNWGFVPFTPEELTKLGQDLKLLVKNEYVAIATYKGEPAAMAVTLPNINDWIADLNGRLLPFGLPKLLWRMLTRPPATLRMPLMGVRKSHHGTAVGSALAISVIETLRRYHAGRGMVSAELSWILEDNMAMRRIVEGMGGKPYKTYRIFEKALL